MTPSSTSSETYVTNVPNSPLFSILHTMAKRTQAVAFRRPRVMPRRIRQYRGPSPPTNLTVIPRLPITTTPSTDIAFSYSGTGTMTRRKYRSRTGVTSQHDYSLIYRKKAMPYRKRKLWSNFLRKNIAADMKLMGTKTFVFNHSITRIVNNAAGNAPTGGAAQECGVCHLYGNTAEPGDPAQIQLAEVGYRDVHRVTNALISGAPAGDVSRGAFRSTKLVFGSAVLDITVTNTAPTFTTDPTPVQQFGGRVEIDLYDIVYRKTTVDESIHGYRLMVDNGNSNQDAPLAGVGTPNYFSRGWTPFDSCQAISQYGIKILKKTKYFMSPNTSITYQIRDARNRLLDVQDGNQFSGLARKGWTRSVLIVIKTVPGEVFGARVAIGCTRKYMLKLSKSAGSDQTTAIAGAG